MLSKDRITAGMLCQSDKMTINVFQCLSLSLSGDGLKSHEMVGKAVLSTQTNCALFDFLNAVGVSTHFVSRVMPDKNADWDRAFVARKCQMIPIEWVARYAI